MKLKNYIEFSNNRTLNEEFVGKLWRDITGKNKDRVQECRSDIDSILNELKKKKDFFDTHSYLFKEYPFSEISIDTVRNLNFDDYVKRIINESVDKLTIEVKKNYPNGSCYTEIERFFKEIFIELFEKNIYLITNSQIEFIKKYDSEEYSIFVTYINKIIYSLDSSDKLLTPNVPFQYSKYQMVMSSDRDRNFIYSMVSKIEEEFLTDLIIHILKESNQIKSKFLNIYQQIKEQDDNLFYYLQILTNGDIKDGEYDYTLSNFLKSLVLRLRQKNHKYIIKKNELDDYKYVDTITNDSNTSYTSEYGVNFLDKIKIDLTKTKVSDLESFKSLKESIKRLEKFTKLDENIKNFNQIIGDISSYINKFGYKLEDKFPDLLKKIKEKELIWDITNKINIDSLKQLKNDYTEIVGKEAKYYEDITLKKLNKKQDTWIYIDFQSIIRNFQLFESDYGNSIIQDLLLKRGRQFKGINTIKIVEKDTTNIWLEDEQLLGGNILYHGSIHYNLDKPGEIRKLIYKNSPYTLRYSGYGMYLTNLLSSAAHYQYLRATQGTVNASSGGLDDQIKQKFETPNSEYFPTIYRITLKPGVVFEHKPQGDTSCDRDELNHYRNIGSAGFHSGNSDVGGGDTVEITIVDENSIIKVEKVKPSEILNLDDDIWNRGSKQLSKDEFLKWYKDLIQKRKENLE